MRPRIADSYVPTIYNDILGAGGSAALANATWPAANRAIYTPVIFPFPCQVYSLTFIAANGTGNYDLGFIDGYTKAKIASSGSTAMTAAGPKTLSISPDYRVDAGKMYYAALALSSTSGSITRNNSALPSMIAAGLGQEASGLPIPSTITPATLASAYVPLLIFGIR